MLDFFTFLRLLRRSALMAALAVAAPATAGAEENPLRAVTNAIGLTAPTGERPDFVNATRPQEEKLDFIPFLAPEKKRIPVKTPAQAAADDADLVATRNQAQARLKKLQAESVETLKAPAKPPPVQDKF